MISAPGTQADRHVRQRFRKDLAEPPEQGQVVQGQACILAVIRDFQGNAEPNRFFHGKTQFEDTGFLVCGQLPTAANRNRAAIDGYNSLPTVEGFDHETGRGWGCRRSR